MSKNYRNCISPTLLICDVQILFQFQVRCATVDNYSVLQRPFPHSWLTHENKNLMTFLFELELIMKDLNLKPRQWIMEATIIEILFKFNTIILMQLEYLRFHRKMFLCVATSEDCRYVQGHRFAWKVRAQSDARSETCAELITERRRSTTAKSIFSVWTRPC